MGYSVVSQHAGHPEIVLALLRLALSHHAPGKLPLLRVASARAPSVRPRSKRHKGSDGWRFAERTGTWGAVRAVGGWG